MAKSKAYISFVLLFAFLLSSVLAHELRGTYPKNENQHSYSDEGNVFKHQNPTSSQDMETHWRGGSSMPSFSHFGGHGHKTSRLDDVGKSTRSYIGEVDQFGEPKRYQTFPRASRKTMPGIGRSHYTHSTTYNPSNSKFTEPKNYMGASVTRHRSMVRPSEIDCRAFHGFQAKTFGIKNGGKTGYDGVPRMEDIGEETKN